MCEVGELHLRHRPLAGQRETEPDAGDGGFRQRRVDDARLAESLAQAVGDQEHAALLAHVLSQHHDALVALHLFGET